MKRSSPWLSRVTVAWLLAASPALGQDVEFPRGVDRVECPLILLSNGNLPGVPAVEGTLRGTKVLFMVDTGANTCAIDTAVIEKLDLRQTGSDLMSGLGGFTKVATYRISGLRFGAMDVSGMRCMGRDVQRFSRGRDAALGGVLASPFFSRVPTTVDFRARKIVFWNPEEFEPPDAPAIPITSMLGVPVVRAAIGGLEAQVVIDTGAEPALLLYPAFVERHLVVESGEGHPSMPLLGWSGNSKSRFAQLSDLALGDIALRDVTVTLVLEATKFGMESDRLRAGMIGTALLSSFVVTLDYRRLHIYLQAHDGAVARRPTGVFFSRVDGSLRVVGVVDGTPAADLLQEDDEVESIDGRPPPATLSELYELLRSREVLRMHVVRDGKSLDLEVPRWDSAPPVVFAPKEK